MASLLPGRKLFLSILRSRLRIFMVVAEVGLDRAGVKKLTCGRPLQWSATSSGPASADGNATACLLFVRKASHQQRR